MNLKGVKKGDIIFVSSARSWLESGDYRVLRVGRRWLTALYVKYDAQSGEHLSRRFDIETGGAESGAGTAYRNKADFERLQLVNQRRDQIRRWAAHSMGRNHIADAAPELIDKIHALIFPDGVPA